MPLLTEMKIRNCVQKKLRNYLVAFDKRIAKIRDVIILLHQQDLFFSVLENFDFCENSYNPNL